MRAGYHLGWFVPFVCLGLVALAAVRPAPHAPPAKGERVVVDARGKPVHIPLPFRGSVLTRGTEIPDYLEATGRPDTLLAVTARGMGARVRGHIIGHIFPQVLADRRIWASAGVSDVAGPKVEIERLLLFDPGVYMGWYTLAEPVERVGLSFVGFKTFPTSLKDLGYEDRAYSGVVGDPARGEAIEARQAALISGLDQELKADKAMARPRYLYMFSRVTDPGVTVLGAKNHYTRFFATHAGVVNACACDNYYAAVDAEHIAAYDPDIIVLGPQANQETPEQFLRDPRWRGLKAVREHRVYRAPPGVDQFIAYPFWSRWLAEIAHPDRLQPKSRDLYRDYMQWLLHYRLSDAELDTAFAVKDNRAMVDAVRFQAAKAPV